jgi:iron complex outermembrane receptor protein
MRFLIATISFCFILVTQAYDQGALVRGRVVDPHSETPLAGVHVMFATARGTLTDDRGIFQFEASPGKYTLTFQYMGYRSFTKAVLLKPGDTLFLDIKMRPEIREIDEIVVSPNRSEQKLSESTVSMNIIKPVLIRKNHITRIDEAIAHTPGIEIMDGQASIRGGSGYSYGVGSRVMMLIDGMPALSADAGNIKWQFMPLENLSQIEVIKGASSVLYGSSALNGVINIRTADPDTLAEIEVSLLGGIYDRPKQKNWVWWESPRFFSNATFAYANRLKQTDMTLGARWTHDDGYRKLNHERTGSVHLKLKQHARKPENLTYGLYFNAGYSDRIDFILWEDAEYGALKHNPSTAREFNGTMVLLDPFVTYQKDQRYRHDVRGRFQYTRNRLPDSRQNNSDATTYFSEYQLWHPLAKPVEMVVGGMVQFNQIESNFYGDHQGFNAALYTQFDVRPMKALKLTGGIRLEYNVLNGKHDRVVPIFRAGINVQATPYTFLRASFGQGYRYPSITEKYASTTLGAVRIFPNPEIEAESGWSTELGVKQSLAINNLRGQLDLSFFYLQNRDLIEYIFGLYPDTVNQVYDYGFMAVNTEHSRVYGFEFEFMMGRSFGAFSTSMRGGYTFMYPVEFNQFTGRNTGTYLKYRRKHAFTIQSITTFKSVDLGWTLFCKSKILNIDDVFLNPLTREVILPGFYDYWNRDNKGHVLLDAYLAYRLSSRYRFSFSVKNLFNTEYLGRPGDIQPQRHYSIQVTGSF